MFWDSIDRFAGPRRPLPDPQETHHCLTQPRRGLRSTQTHSYSQKSEVNLLRLASLPGKAIPPCELLLIIPNSLSTTPKSVNRLRPPRPVKIPIVDPTQRVGYFRITTRKFGPGLTSPRKKCGLGPRSTEARIPWREEIIRKFRTITTT